MKDIYPSLEKWHRAGLKTAVALLVNAQHSSPRLPGARMIVNEAGEMAGSVSMGCVEGDLREHLLKTIREGTPRLIHYGISEEMAASVGLSCGGEIDVLLSVFDDRTIPVEVWKSIADGGRAVFFAGLEGHSLGRELIFLPDGKRLGSLGCEAADEEAVNLSQDLFHTGGTLCKKLQATNERVFAESFQPAAPLAVVGASPLSAAVCKLASFADYDVTLIDPRKAFAVKDNYPDASRIIHQWPDDGMKAAGVNENWYVAVLAHDAKIDVPALAYALKAGCRYVGLLGSRRTQESRKRSLRDLGFGEADLRRIHGPIGLEIEAETLREIAVSVVAELIAARRGKIRDGV